MTDETVSATAEQQRAEDRLQDSEQRHRDLFENSPVSLWEEDLSAVKARIDELRAAGVDDFEAHFQAHPEEVAGAVAATKVLSVNQAALLLHKAETKDQLLAGLSETFTDESFEAFRDELVHLASQTTSYEREATVKTLDGQRRDVLVRFRVVPGHEKTWSRVLVSLVDITKRKRAEEDLRQSEEKFRQLADQALLGIGIVQDGIFKYVNQAMADLSECTIDQMLAWGPEELAERVHPDDRAYAMQQLARLQNGHLEVQRTYPLRIVTTQTGSVKWLEQFSKVIRYEDSYALLTLVADVTARKRAEQALQNAYRRLMAVREDERRRVAAELHDSVGQGLVALKLAMRDTMELCRARDDCTAVEGLTGAAARCDDLIREVRAICHGLFPPALEPLGLAAAMQQLRDQTKTGGTRVRLACGHDVEGMRFPGEVEIAMFRIAQEAVSNAVAHGRASSIYIRLKYADGQLSLRVRNDGAGFDPEQVAGNGLGISSMTERAQAIGGELDISSQPGKTVVAARAPTRPLATGRPGK